MFKDVGGKFLELGLLDGRNSQVYGISDKTYYIVSPVVGTGYMYVINVFLRHEKL